MGMHETVVAVYSAEEPRAGLVCRAYFIFVASSIAAFSVGLREEVR